VRLRVLPSDSERPETSRQARSTVPTTCTAAQSTVDYMGHYRSTKEK